MALANGWPYTLRNPIGKLSWPGIFYGLVFRRIFSISNLSISCGIGTLGFALIGGVYPWGIILGKNLAARAYALP